MKQDMARNWFMQTGRPIFYLCYCAAREDSEKNSAAEDEKQLGEKNV